MSLFANKPATSGGLFSNTGGAAGTGGGGGGGLFANAGGQAGAGAGAGTGGGGGLFANTGGAAGTGAGAGTGTGGGGGLFANTGGAAGTGTGTGTGSGGLFAGNTGGSAGTGAGTGTGGGGLFSGSGTGMGTGMGTGAGMGGGSYSLSAPAINTHQEAEFNQVLERFSETLDLRNPVTCLFKHPVYQVAQIHGPPPPEAGQFKFLFDQALWEEYQKNLPPQSSKYQFYIGFVIGMEALEKRVKNMINLFESLNKTESEFRAKQDGLLKEYDTKLKEDINRIKRKNFILLDKLLTVHALLEKVALQYNECNRKPNEEMRLYNKYVTLEAVPNEIQTRLLDIRLNRENAKVTKPRNTLSHVTDPESKRNVLDLLTKMKKGVEILNKMHQEDAKDVEQMLKYAENKGKLY